MYSAEKLQVGRHINHGMRRGGAEKGRKPAKLCDRTSHDFLMTDFLRLWLFLTGCR